METGQKIATIDDRKPNFSGTWKFNPSKSVLQIQAPDSTVLTIDHREPIFRLSRTHTVGKTSDTFALDLTTDGTEVVMKGLHRILLSRCSWDGDRLVFSTNFVIKHRKATNIVKYSLSTDGKVITAEESFNDSVLRYNNLWVIEKE